MIPLHVVASNSHVPMDTVAAKLETKMSDALFLDNKGRNPLDCALK